MAALDVAAPAITDVDTAGGWLAQEVRLPVNTNRVSVIAVTDVATAIPILCRIALVGEDGVVLEDACLPLQPGDCWYHECRYSPGVSTVTSIFVATDAAGVVVVETEA